MAMLNKQMVTHGSKVDHFPVRTSTSQTLRWKSRHNVHGLWIHFPTNWNEGALATESTKLLPVVFEFAKLLQK
jgi:hypothetical protein